MQSRRDTNFVVTPNETDDHGILLSALHPVHCAYLELEAVCRSENRGQQGDLRLVPMKVNHDVNHRFKTLLELCIRGNDGDLRRKHTGTCLPTTVSHRI